MSEAIKFDDDELWPIRTVMEKTGLSRSTIMTHCEAGKMPKPRRLGLLLVWVRSEMVEWMRALPVATPDDDLGENGAVRKRGKEAA